MLQDWGTGIELSLYEEALVHFFGGVRQVIRDVPVVSGGLQIGAQPMRLIDSRTAFKVTSLRREVQEFEDHGRRLLLHTPLSRILWANITAGEVTFLTIDRNE